MVKILFDIGANVGNYSRENSHKYDKIICVEPIRDLCVNLPSKCTIVNKIISNNPNDEFYKCDNCVNISTACKEWREGNGRFANGGRYDINSTWSLYKCPVSTLDDLVDEYGIPDLIKIDVEGYEYNVLRSFTKRFNGIISFEWAEEMKSEIINSIEYLYNVTGHSLFHVQYEDCYTYVPNEDSWVSKEEIIKFLNENLVPERQELWGMMWSKP